MTIIHNNVDSKPFIPQIYFSAKIGSLIKAGVLTENDEVEFCGQRSLYRKKSDGQKVDFSDMIAR